MRDGLRLEDEVTNETARREALMMGLRLTEGLSHKTWQEKFGTILAGDEVALGIDGTQDNAGGFVTAGSMLSEDLGAALAAHRTHALFQAHEGLIITGPSLTNVNDIRMIAVEPR